MSQPAQPYAVGTPYAVAPGVPEGLAVTGLVLASVYTVVEVILFLTSFGAADTYVDAARQGTDAADVLTAYDLLSVSYVVLLPLWVVTCLFLQRARRRAAALAPGFHHQRSQGWTWFGWVVPVVGLWFPYQVVRDIVRNAWRDQWGDQHQRLHLGLWWAMWVVSLVAGQVTSRLIPFSGPPDADAVALLPLFQGITAVATVVGLVLWMRIVSSLLHALKSPLV
jgi:heme/copper-type cytochrome/quinol oxidase subunit 2